MANSKAEDPTSNKGNFAFPPQTVYKCDGTELQSNKESSNSLPPISTSSPAFSDFSPFSRKKFCTPQVTQFLEGPTPPPLIREGGGGSNYVNYDSSLNLSVSVKVIPKFLIQPSVNASNRCARGN